MERRSLLIIVLVAALAGIVALVLLLAQSPPQAQYPDVREPDREAPPNPDELPGAVRQGGTLKGSVVNGETGKALPGATVIALDTHDGSRLATLELPSEKNRILAPVLTTADGKIVLAIQRYDPADAALVVFELKPPVEPTAEEEVAYNEPGRPEEGAAD